MSEDKLARLRESPVVYQAGKPTSVIVDLELFQYLLDRLGELEDYELFNDPEVVERLQTARQHHLAGRLITHYRLIERLGLENDV